MKYAIIAAGEGSRLAQEGVLKPKPLVEIGGERLIDRLMRVFMANGASEIVVICNEQMTAVKDKSGSCTGTWGHPPAIFGQVNT